MTLSKKITIFSVLVLFLMLSTSVFAGDPPPVGGDPTGDPGNSLGSGGSAPISDGYLYLLAMALSYTFYRYSPILFRLLKSKTS